MIITTVLNAFDNKTGINYSKRRNRGSIYRRLPAHNDTDDYHDSYNGEKDYEALEMYRWENFSYDYRGVYLLLKIVGIFIITVLVIGLIGVGMLRFWLIPQELQSYTLVSGKHKIGYLVLQKQQIIKPKLLAQLTYLNANGQLQMATDTQDGNAAILEVAFIELPGFGIPGGQSGIKLIGMDLQTIDATNTSNDPPVLSNKAVPLNGGADGFFRYAQKSLIPSVEATLYTFSTEPIKGSLPHCFNIYVMPDLTFTAEPAPGQCISPFTHS